MTVTERPPGGTVIDLVHRHLALWSTTDAAERRRRLPVPQVSHASVIVWPEVPRCRGQTAVFRSARCSRADVPAWSKPLARCYGAW
jgi:hypothetical protein